LFNLFVILLEVIDPVLDFSQPFYLRQLCILLKAAIKGTSSHKVLSGKKFSFFGDPQIWVTVNGNLSAGTRINIFYHLLSEADAIQINPVRGLRCQFQE
jgi:hypothetical protein